MWPLCGPGCEARGVGEERFREKDQLARRIVFGEMKNRGTLKAGASLGMARQEVLRPNRSSAGLSASRAAPRASQFVASFVRLCALSQELDTKAPPWTRPAGGFPLPGAFPCGGLFPYIRCVSPLVSAIYLP